MNDFDINTSMRGLTSSAVNKFAVNDLNGAVEDLKAAEMMDPRNPEILHNLAVCYARMGLYRTSAEYCEKLISADTGYVDTAAVKKMFAYSLAGLREYEECINVIDELLTLYPMDESALSIKAFALEKSGDSRRALSTYRQILVLNPANSGAMNSAAYIIAETGGDIDEAYRMISSALKQKPGSGAYLDTLGCVLLKKNDYARARNAFLKALKIIPWSEDVIEHINSIE